MYKKAAKETKRERESAAVIASNKARRKKRLQSSRDW